MPRPLRIEFENAWYHVMNRGANHQSIFKNKYHRQLFCLLLRDIVEKFEVEIHAFCLMDNHYHLIIKTPRSNLSAAMRHLDGVYTQRFNRSTRRDGPLFRGRYKAILIESDGYLLQVSRYIHLNPVSAKICSDPYNFEWSSFRSYAVEQLSIPWLNTIEILKQINHADSRKTYIAFVMQGTDEETKKFYSKIHPSSIYGSKAFIEKHLNHVDCSYKSETLTDYNRTKPLPEIRVILNHVINHFQILPDNLYRSGQGKKNLPKIIAIYLLRYLAHLSHRSIAKIFDEINVKSIGMILIRLENKIVEDSSLKQQVNLLIERIKS